MNNSPDVGKGCVTQIDKDGKGDRGIEWCLAGMFICVRKRISERESGAERLNRPSHANHAGLIYTRRRELIQHSATSHRAKPK